jgi:hypothetical protein
MADKVLYFPSIRPPENEWFTRVLLYWDQVGTIMPTESEAHTFTRPYTRALIREKLLVPVSLGNDFWYVDAAGHFAAFVDLVKRDPLHVKDQPAGGHQWAKVHLDKIGLPLAGALRFEGLVKEPVPQADSAWVEVEWRTAHLLMAFLAAVLGKDERVGMDPVTDSATAMQAFTALPEGNGSVDTDPEPIRYTLLRDILPAPAAGIEPAELAQFKADHRSLLNNFRIRVEDAIIVCARETDLRLRDLEIANARRKLKAELDEVEGRMRERRWPMAARGALGVAIAALGLADIAVTGGLGFSLAASSLGLAASVDGAFQGRRRSDIFQSPLAFAALARRDLGPTDSPGPIESS